MGGSYCVSWQGGYDQLLKKYGLEGETGSAKEWKERVHERNCRDWMEEVEGKSSLKWYRMVKDEAGLEEYTRSLVGQEGVRLRFDGTVVREECKKFREGGGR